MGIKRSGAMETDAPTMESTFHLTTDDEVVHHEKHDVTGILKANHFQQTTQDLHHTSEVTNHVARIDTIAIINWCKMKGMKQYRDEAGNTVNIWQQFFEDPKLLTEFLNDPDNQCWRTRLGKI